MSASKLLAPTTAGLLLLLSASPSWSQCGILSWEGYRNRRHAFPYVLRLETPPGELLMFGAQHTNDPSHPQLREIERLWREFRPQVAFSEGGIRPAARSFAEAVTRFGEPGLLRMLADRDHVALRNLEPPEDGEAAVLAPQFQPGQVKLFYILRNLSSGSPADRRSFEERRRAALESARQRQRLTGLPNSLKELDAVAARFLPELIDWHSISRSWFDPTRADTFLNEISRRSSDHRNCYMLPLVISAVREGKRVFVVVGGSHVVMQEEFLRSALRSR
jgi:hypothetical protein